MEIALAPVGLPRRSRVLLIGATGAGKMHLAIALGHCAVHAGHLVYDTTAADLVARTSRAALEPLGQHHGVGGLTGCS